jgi:hypothetical protein
MLATGLMQRLVGCPERAALVRAQPATIKQLESLGQLLLRKLDMEAKYLNRLEGDLLFWAAVDCLLHIKRQIPMAERFP